jgi:hypothetical protein
VLEKVNIYAGTHTPDVSMHNNKTKDCLGALCSNAVTSLAPKENEQLKRPLKLGIDKQDQIYLWSEHITSLTVFNVMISVEHVLIFLLHGSSESNQV